MDVFEIFHTFIVSGIGGCVALCGNYLLTRYQENNKFRLTALEKQLAAHQEAFTLWHQLRFTLDDVDRCNASIYACQEWWVKNCLYLPATVRREFYHGFMGTLALQDLPIEARAKQHERLDAIGRLIEESLDRHVSGTVLKPPIGSRAH